MHATAASALLLWGARKERGEVLPFVVGCFLALLGVGTRDETWKSERDD